MEIIASELIADIQILKIISRETKCDIADHKLVDLEEQITLLDEKYKSQKYLEKLYSKIQQCVSEIYDSLTETAFYLIEHPSIEFSRDLLNILWIKYKQKIEFFHELNERFISQNIYYGVPR